MATCAELRSKQDFYFYIRIFLCSSHNYHALQQQTLAAYRCKSKVNNFKSLFLTSNVKASWCIYSEKCGRRLQTGVWMTSWATAAADEQLRAVKKIQLVPNVKLKDFCWAQINWRKVKMMYLLQISQNKYYIKVKVIVLYVWCRTAWCHVFVSVGLVDHFQVSDLEFQLGWTCSWSFPCSVVIEGPFSLQHLVRLLFIMINKKLNLRWCFEEEMRHIDKAKVRKMPISK